MFFVVDIAGFAMSREDKIVIGQGEEAALDFLDKQPIIAAREVGATDASAEEGIASDDQMLVVKHKTDTSRTMTRDIAALNTDLTKSQHIIVLDGAYLQVAHVLHLKAHDRTVGLGLTQEARTVRVHRDRKTIAFAYLAKTGDVVDMSVCEQDIFHLVVVVCDILCQLSLFIRGTGSGVDNGATPSYLVIYQVGVHAKMIKCKSLNHILLLKV